MSTDNDQTKPPPAEFDFSAYPRNTLFHERRTSVERPIKLTKKAITDQQGPPSPGARQPKKERRRRIDPTTFDKQYTDAEMEFMNAVQRFKEQSGRAFPSYGEVLKVAVQLGYRQFIEEPGPASHDPDEVGDVSDPTSF
jgi:hypothetical protein